MGKKSVQPISGTQTGELCRLLEARLCGHDIFQTRMIENPNGLCFFLCGKFGFAIGKTITVGKKNAGFICEIEDNNIVGIAASTCDYAMGNILRLGDKVKINAGFYAGKFGEVIKIFDPDILSSRYSSRSDIIQVALSTGADIYSHELSDLIW